MMKKEVLIVMIFLIFASCSNEPKIEKVEFIISHSFNNPTEYTINTKKKTLKIYSFKDHYYITKYIDSISYKRIRRDTLIEYFNHTYDLKEKDLKKFIQKTKHLDSTFQNIEPIFDGIGYRIRKITKKDTISLTSNITERKDKSKLEYELLDAFFTLAENNVNDFEGNFILEGTQSFFSYKKKVNKIEKVSENPIEYKIWRTLNGCKKENKELIRFLKNLPNKTPIIFDLRKGNFSDCIYQTIFPEFKDKELYFYGDYKMQDLENLIKSAKNEMKNGNTKPKTKNEKLVDKLLDEKPTEVILKELISYKDSLNHKYIYLNRNQILRTIANKQYNQ